MRLIARLPQDQAEAVVLRVVVGLDAKSAAEVLGKRPGAVRTAAHRGLQRLAELLGEEPDGSQDRNPDSSRAGGEGGAGQRGGPSGGPYGPARRWRNGERGARTGRGVATAWRNRTYQV